MFLPRQWALDFALHRFHWNRMWKGGGGGVIGATKTIVCTQEVIVQRFIQRPVGKSSDVEIVKHHYLVVHFH